MIKQSRPKFWLADPHDAFPPVRLCTRSADVAQRWCVEMASIAGGDVDLAVDSPSARVRCGPLDRIAEMQEMAQNILAAMENWPKLE